MTNDDIKKELDEKGVEYGENDKKDKLLKILKKSEKVDKILEDSKNDIDTTEEPTETVEKVPEEAPVAPEDEPEVDKKNSKYIGKEIGKRVIEKVEDIKLGETKYKKVYLDNRTTTVLSIRDLELQIKGQS